MTTTASSPQHRAAEAFVPIGSIVSIGTLDGGLINDSFLVATERFRLVLQRISRQAFPKPELIMENLRVLLMHAHDSRIALRLPAIVPTRDGRDYWVDADGGFWRALEFVANTRAPARLENLAQARGVGSALGRFHAMVHDLDPRRLHVTRERFHDTPWYYARFTAVAEQASPIPADPALQFCIDFARARASRVSSLEDARRRGELSMHVIHGDPKLENVLFDVVSGEAVSLIDLDTVQPGLIHYDLGDCLRSACNPAGETPPDPASARFDLDICRALLDSYFVETRAFLTDNDLRHLPDAIRLIPLELGLRFLTDHLQGDRYFKVKWRGHNLHRARTQFVLTESIETQMEKIRALIDMLARAN